LWDCWAHLIGITAFLRASHSGSEATQPAAGRPGAERRTILGRLFAAHRLFHQTYEDEQCAPANSPRRDLGNERPDVIAAWSDHGTCIGPAVQQQADNLCSDPAPDYPGNRVADDAEVILLHRKTDHVAARDARNQLNYQTDYSAPHVEPPLTALHSLASWMRRLDVLRL
jgi:hypothetical protein